MHPGWSLWLEKPTVGARREIGGEAARPLSAPAWPRGDLCWRVGLWGCGERSSPPLLSTFAELLGGELAESQPPGPRHYRDLEKPSRRAPSVSTGWCLAGQERSEVGGGQDHPVWLSLKVLSLQHPFKTGGRWQCQAHPAGTWCSAGSRRRRQICSGRRVAVSLPHTAPPRHHHYVSSGPFVPSEGRPPSTARWLGWPGRGTAKTLRGGKGHFEVTASFPRAPEAKQG